MKTRSESTPFEKFQALAQGVISVPKTEIDKRDAAWKKDKAEKKSKK